MAKNVNFLDNAPDFVFKALRSVKFEDPTGLARPLWRDGSRYQGLWNFNISKAGGVKGIAFRSSISWGYKDPMFQQYWDTCGAVGGIYRTSYHVIYPDQPVLPQADNWYEAAPEIDIIPRVIDLEIQNSASSSQIAQATWNLSEIVKSRDGVRPIIYSRRLLINNWLASWTTQMLNEHYWWLAQYLWDRATEHPGPPTPPSRVDVSRIILHQTADKKPGFPGEVQSAALDYDRWELGDEAAMHKFIADTWGSSNPPPPPPPDPGECDCEPEIANLQQQIDGLVSRVDGIETSVQAVENSVLESTAALAALTSRVEVLEENLPGTPGFIGVPYVVTDDKTLAEYQTGWNGVNNPITSIWGEPGNRLKWPLGSYVYTDGNGAIQADGYKVHVIQPGSPVPEGPMSTVPESPVLYVKDSDIAKI